MGLRAVSGGGVTNPLPSGYTYPNPTITGTVTASQVVGIERVLAQWGVPVGLASSGTMGNNGAASGMTALPATFSGGMWLYIPAGAIAAGEPATAAFRWFKASSTTAGTFYNSSWDGSGIPPLGTDTPYVTTGPGAFTGIAAGEIVAATITIPAGALGPNGRLSVDSSQTNNTAAGNKMFRIRYSGAAGTVLSTQTASTAASSGVVATLRNMGSAALQAIESYVTSAGAATAGTNTVFTTNDTAAGATTVVYSLEKATATNHAILLGGVAKISYAP
jgi:hypothetical protein